MVEPYTDFLILYKLKSSEVKLPITLSKPSRRVTASFKSSRQCFVVTKWLIKVYSLFPRHLFILRTVKQQTIALQARNNDIAAATKCFDCSKISPLYWWEWPRSISIKGATSRDTKRILINQIRITRIKAFFFVCQATHLKPKEMARYMFVSMVSMDTRFSTVKSQLQLQLRIAKVLP